MSLGQFSNLFRAEIIVFSRVVTAALLVYLNNGTTAMLVYPANPLGIDSIIMQTFSFVSVEKQGY